MRKSNYSILQLLEKVTDIFCIGFFWLLCSLPLITIGASTTALYHVVYKVLRHDEGYMRKEFFSSFRSNFKQSTISWLIIIFLALFLGMDAYFAYQISIIWDGYSWAFLPFLILLALVLMCSNYIFPYIARFQDTTKQTFKNAVFICLCNLPYSILLLVLLLLTIVLCFTAPIGILFLPVLYMLIASFLLEHIFDKYRNAEEQVDYDNI